MSAISSKERKSLIIKLILPSSRLLLLRFFLAVSIAFSEISIDVISKSIFIELNSFPRAIEMHPEPVPASYILTCFTSDFSISLRTFSTSNSVSGRGIRTCLLTASVQPKN